MRGRVPLWAVVCRGRCRWVCVPGGVCVQLCVCVCVLALVRLSPGLPPAHQFVLVQIWLTFMRCFDYPVKDNTIKLANVWFTLSFG